MGSAKKSHGALIEVCGFKKGSDEDFFYFIRGESRLGQIRQSWARMTTFSEGSDIRVTILGKVAGLKEEGLGFSFIPYVRQSRLGQIRTSLGARF